MGGEAEGDSIGLEREANMAGRNSCTGVKFEGLSFDNRHLGSISPLPNLIQHWIPMAGT